MHNQQNFNHQQNPKTEESKKKLNDLPLVKKIYGIFKSPAHNIKTKSGKKKEGSAL